MVDLTFETRCPQIATCTAVCIRLPTKAQKTAHSTPLGMGQGQLPILTGGADAARRKLKAWELGFPER